MKKILIAALILMAAGLATFLFHEHSKRPASVEKQENLTIEKRIRERGELLLKEKMYAPLIATYKKMLEKMPGNVELKKKLAFAYFGAGKYDDTRSILEEVSKTGSADDEVRRELEFIKNLK